MGSNGGPRRAFTAEYKMEVVELCRSGGRSIGRVCRDLGLGETAVRRWVAQVDSGRRSPAQIQGPPGPTLWAGTSHQLSVP